MVFGAVGGDQLSLVYFVIISALIRKGGTSGDTILDILKHLASSQV
ncbi:MAG: hypothetical protein WCI55_01560 [Armatimonadota bacterium]